MKYLLVTSFLLLSTNIHTMDKQTKKELKQQKKIERNKQKEARNQEKTRKQNEKYEWQRHLELREWAD